MPPVSRIGDIGLGHGSFPPTPIITGSLDVFTNDIPTARIGDFLLPHGSPSPSPPHGRLIVTGSLSVFVNSRNCARISDFISCGIIICTGSGNVNAGG